MNSTEAIATETAAKKSHYQRIREAAGNALIKTKGAADATVNTVKSGSKFVARNTVEGVKSGSKFLHKELKGKIKNKGFATKNIKGTINRQNKFQQFARNSFTSRDTRASKVTIEDPSGTGMWKYETEGSPYNAFGDQSYLTEKMTRPYRPGLAGMPFNVYGNDTGTPFNMFKKRK